MNTTGKGQSRILALPVTYSFGVIGVCLLGIVIGSFRDYEISAALAHVTGIGDIFATVSPMAAYALVPVGLGCFYTGLKKKASSGKIPGWIIRLLTWIAAILVSDGFYGGTVRFVLGFVLDDTSKLFPLAAWLFWAAAYAVIFAVMPHIMDDTDPNRLMAVGLGLWISMMASDLAVQWLKEIGSRPRYKYLLTLADPYSGYRNWWQMMPHTSGGNGDLLSWPSGHMSVIGDLFALPLFFDCMKHRSDRRNRIVFLFVCIYMVICCYNRIHMTNHFLSDVCFGTLDAFLIISVICSVFLRIAKGKRVSGPDT